MADINVERKGPSIWPWIIGLIVLALLIWAIAEMVDTEEPAVAEVEPVERVEQPPAAVPAPTPMTGAPLGTLMPLGPEDVGQAVLLEGTVVGTPTPAGFWVESRDVDNEVIFVQAPARTRTGEMLAHTDIQSGTDVEVIGMIQEMPRDRATRWIEDARLRDSADFADWTVHQDLMLGSAPAGAQPGQPGMQPSQPGMKPTQPAQPGTRQPTRPGDTVQGRY